jgi:hypothetical protein
MLLFMRYTDKNNDKKKKEKKNSYKIPKKTPTQDGNHPSPKPHN